jgi:outer membrane receptor protein involved in Fe transport
VVWGFRVGNGLNNPNDLLGPESLDGVEGGFDWRWGPRFHTRVTAFWNQLENAVSNVTVSSSPNLITRRRQNVGEIRVKGLETDTGLTLWRYWSLRLSYLWNDAVVTDFPPNLALAGKQVPQVPYHRASASLSYSHPRLLEAFASLRFVGSQYDDDLNLFALGNFPVFDVQVARMVNRSFSLFASAENLLNRRYAVARTPLENIGTPRLVHAGIRLQF